MLLVNLGILCGVMALPIPMMKHKNIEEERKIYWDHSHEKLDCFIKSYFNMPPGINSCITLDERSCENCYSEIYSENISGIFFCLLDSLLALQITWLTKKTN